MEDFLPHDSGPTLTEHVPKLGLRGRPAPRNPADRAMEVDIVVAGFTQTNESRSVLAM